MLVLSRRAGEEICIDNRITVTVVKVQGGRVRLGFEAPQSVSIVRGELADPPKAAPVYCDFEYEPTACAVTGQES